MADPEILPAEPPDHVNCRCAAPPLPAGTQTVEVRPEKRLGSGLPETPDEWRARHVRIAEENMAVLRASGLRFELRESPDGLLGAPVLFREPRRVRVDFYPSTGRWRRVGKTVPSRLWRGGARKFLDWYRKQQDPQLITSRAGART